MKITLVRDDGKVNTLRTLKIELLLEQMKTEVKAQPVSKMREALRYTLPGNSIEGVRKVPKVIPAAAFVRKEGVMTLNEYNGVVMMEVNHLSGRTEADEIKELVKEFPQTFLAFTGSSGKSVKIWVRFTYPDDRLPVSREQVELFHAHAYQTAVKYYQPQLPFDIELKEPLLEQYCRLTYDPELYFNPEAMPIYMKQPVSLPSETAFIRRTRKPILLCNEWRPDMRTMKRCRCFSPLHSTGRLRNWTDIGRETIYNRCWCVWRSIASGRVFPKKIPCGGRRRITGSLRTSC